MKDFFIKMMSNVKDDTSSFNENEIIEGKNLSILCYLIPIIPYLLNKNNSYVKYHSLIGMNLFIIIILYYILFKIIIYSGINIILLKIILVFIWIILLLLVCLGISNVCNQKACELPLINKIKIFK